jgi:hypothetical protein
MPKNMQEKQDVTVRAQSRNVYTYINVYTVEPLLTDTAGEFKFCPL